MKKRILSLMLCVVMLLCLTPQLALLSGAEQTLSGSCGDNLTWTLDLETEVLTVSGTGPMENYNLTGVGEYKEAPWPRSNITALVVEEGVTSIGDYAFYDAYSLASVDLPSTLTEIGESAFEWCISLTDAVLPAKLNKIGACAFSCCEQLATVNIPAEVKFIGSCAFSECVSLQKIELPKGITKIYERTFELCSGLISVSIPDGVTEIGANAFAYCESLTSLSLPGTVKTLGQGAFEGCSSIPNVWIPYGVTSIGENCFALCKAVSTYGVSAENPAYCVDESGVLFNKDKTQLIQYPASRPGAYVIPKSVTKIGSSAFAYSVKLTDVTIPMGVTEIGNDAFWQCISLADVVIPESVKTIGEFAFSFCESIKNVWIPYSVTELGESCFYGCASLTAIGVSDANPNYSSDSCGVLFSKDKTSLISYPCARKGNYTVPAGVVTVWATAFAYAKNLTSLTFHEGLISIGTFAFAYAQKLSSVYLPDGLNSVEDRIFLACSALKQVRLPNSLRHISEAMFGRCTALETLTIPDGVNIIGKSAFWNCTALKELTIPHTVNRIESFAFRDCKNLISLTIPKTVGYLGGWAVDGCESLVNIMIPYGVENDDWPYLGEATALNHVLYTGTEEQWNESYGENFRDVDITVHFNALSTDVQWINADGGSVLYCTTCQKELTEPTRLPQVNPFTDVMPDLYYYEPVMWAVENGITTGTSANSFTPERECTRAQIVTFLWRAKGSPEPKSTSHPFTDIQENAYYYKAVLWAVESGITTGMTATTFGPEESCTRAQAVTFLWRAEGKPMPQGSNPFGDVKEGDFFFEPVLWAVEQGITTGTSKGVFSPNTSCTRAQIVTFLYRTMK